MSWRTNAAAAAAIAWHLALGGSLASAQALDGTELRDLALRGTWLTQDHWGSWSWSDDNRVCIRFFDTGGECADTGTWSIDGNVMCYEFTWWGESFDLRRNCFTVHAKDGFHYESRYHGGALDSIFFSFIVVR